MARRDPAGAAREPRFAGLDRGAMQFWHELAAEMSREWFAANKQRYEDQWVMPMTAVVRQVARRLAPVYRPLRLGEPRTLRIYRDVRFSRDKTPYKTHIAAVLRLAGKPIAQAGTAALYVHLGLDEEYVGVGCYQFDAGRLARWRRAVAGAPGAALLAILARLRKASYAVDRDEAYQRIPRGFAPDHPRADLLKRKGLTCAFPEIPAGLVHEPAWADWLFRHAKATAPLVIWLHRHVG
ncbi:MAG TPA: TIGR02453 family protein [Kofleriaceae bacterium]|nr:TIGR02453 family protein [Kofleriaceae bacterium]